MNNIFLVEPLENTNFPNRDIIKSFEEICRSYLSQMLGNNSLPHNRVVKINYNDGNIDSEEICRAMMHSCRSFGSVAVVESEMNYGSYEDVIALTYNKIVRKDLDLELENPITSIIVKDYETNRIIHSCNMEDAIKLYIRDLNFSYVNRSNDLNGIDVRNLYPCFFLVN